MKDGVETKLTEPKFETLIFAKEAGIASVVLNRPDRLNALNYQMMEDLVDAFRLCECDPEIRTVILRGEGRAFCSGDDLKGVGFPAWMDQEIAYQGGYLNAVKAIRRLRKPVIASIHGFALAAGLDLALACDLIFAAEEAKFGTSYVQRGFAGGTYLLPQFVGLRKAIELLFTGDMIDAKEAQQLGLINRVVPAEQLPGVVMEWANRFAQAATKAIGYTKIGAYECRTLDLEAGLRSQGHTVYYGHQTEDDKEGKGAFAEKRTPKFTGR